MANITKSENQSQAVAPYETRPFSLIDRFFNDSLFDPFNLMTPNLLGNRRLANVGGMFPKVDVTETDNEIKVVANVPGIDPEQLNIEVGDDYLSLSGKVENENKQDSEGKAYRYEREYGEFRREFSLPARVSKDGIVAKARNGVLTITLPKSEEEKRQRVKVEVEK